MSNWSFFKIDDHLIGVYYPKRRCVWGCDWTLSTPEKFSIAFKIMKLVFAGFIRIISIRRIKRGGLTTHRSDPTAPNVSYGQFFIIHGQNPNELGLEESFSKMMV